jgi:hypothetical protein
LNSHELASSEGYWNRIIQIKSERYWFKKTLVGLLGIGMEKSELQSFGLLLFFETYYRKVVISLHPDSDLTVWLIIVRYFFSG